ncbi:MAG: hypothetical protein ABW061_14915 [Polyangiaceae bacterium]
MTRFNCYLMCLALLTSLAGCYATVGHPRHARREVIVHEDHHHHRDHDHHDHWDH